VKTVKEFFGEHTLLSDITTEDINNWIDELKRIGNSGATINHKRTCLSVILKYAVAQGYLDRIPSMGERQKEGKGRIRYLSQTEEQAMFNLFTQWGKLDHADALVLFIDLGLRMSELKRITGREDDCRYDHRKKRWYVSIWENKTDHPRTLPCNDRVGTILTRRIKQYGTEPLFPGMTDAVFRKPWKRAAEVAGFDDDPQFIPYACRHTCASRMAQKGVPLTFIKEWMGHKSINTTMRYAHLCPTTLDSVLEVMDNPASTSLNQTFNDQPQGSDVVADRFSSVSDRGAQDG